MDSVVLSSRVTHQHEGTRCAEIIIGGTWCRRVGNDFSVDHECVGMPPLAHREHRNPCATITGQAKWRCSRIPSVEVTNETYTRRTRSHHGETWNTLRQGVQAVDNAMNIWHVDAIEHGLSLGINPNFYFHSMLQRMLRANMNGQPIATGSREHAELMDMDWTGRDGIRDKLLNGQSLSAAEATLATKTKFHHAGEIEHYQHDVLNRMIDKRLTLVSLPSSNKKLTGALEDYKDHPFSWWEKKGLRLGVGTDNDITLSTSFLREMLILLYTDPLELKITKLLIVTTGETRRPYLSHLLWQMRKAG